MHLDDDIKLKLIQSAGGDARKMLNTIELAASLVENDGKISSDILDEALQSKTQLYDKTGDYHYDAISAFIKSVRGSDPDASVYWLALMLEGGEKPEFIARRLIILASEDIGLANSFALPQAIAAYDACRFIGMPECGVNLAQAVVYMASSKKSIAIYSGYQEALQDVKEQGNIPVPLHLRNASTKMMKEMDYGKDYKYTPLASEKENKKQSFLPKKLKGKKYIK